MAIQYMKISMRNHDRHFDGKLHFLIYEEESVYKKRIICASMIGVPEAITAMTSGVMESRPLFFKADDFARTIDPYRMRQRNIGEGDLAHGMVWNSLATIDGMEEQGESADKSYIVALDGNIEKAVSDHVQSRFGLPSEWSQWYYDQLKDLIFPLEVVHNDEFPLWEHVKAVTLEATEEEVLNIIEVALKDGQLRIPETDIRGRFNPEWSMKEYMVNNSEIFSKMLAALKPRHQVGDPIHPSIGMKMKRIPFPAQANMIQGLVNTLYFENSVICSGDMGTGSAKRSTISAA